MWLEEWLHLAQYKVTLENVFLEHIWMQKWKLRSECQRGNVPDCGASEEGPFPESLWLSSVHKECSSQKMSEADERVNSLLDNLLWTSRDRGVLTVYWTVCFQSMDVTVLVTVLPQFQWPFHCSLLSLFAQNLLFQSQLSDLLQPVWSGNQSTLLCLSASDHMTLYNTQLHMPRWTSFTVTVSVYCQRMWDLCQMPVGQCQ